ncbi:hypothetical protein [Prosthecobacter sp.]
MPALSYYCNVDNTAAVILHRKGYRLWNDLEMKAICAEKNAWDFAADDAVQLLGLISIFESQQPAEYREYWWKIDDPWLLDELPDFSPSYVPVANQSAFPANS